MSNKQQAIRGMKDLLPSESGNWQALEQVVAQMFASYGYQEIRTPICESTDLFCRSIGDVTDIVEKEMYSFADRDGSGITLRPEGTASVVRAVIEHSLAYGAEPRLWYQGPFFRHERPQKGRLRQFHQIGAEIFGVSTYAADVELILLSARLWAELGISDKLELNLNTLGTPAVRKAHKDALVAYLTKNKADLDEDSLRRLGSNPLRILDSKNSEMQDLIVKAPKVTDFLDSDSAAHFEGVTQALTSAGVAYTLNPCLVRGLDYYCHTVFEWTTTALGAQGTVCGGGRYDALVTQLGGKPTPAVGFAAGKERILLLQDAASVVAAPDLYCIAVGEPARAKQFAFTESLRSQFSNLRIQMHLTEGSLKSQMKRADKSGATYALILGEDEIATNTVTVKPLREKAEQQQLDSSALHALLNELGDKE